MAFVTLEDRHGSVEVTVFSTLYAGIYELLTEDSAVMVEGRVQKDENAVKLVADSIVPMETAEEKWAGTVHLYVDADNVSKPWLENLKAVMGRYTGPCRSILHLRLSPHQEAVIELPATLGLKPGSALRSDLEQLPGCLAMATAPRPLEAAPRPNGGRFGNGHGGRAYGNSRY